MLVPLSALVVFGIGYFIAFLVSLAWHGMPNWVKWVAGGVLVVMYLIDSMRREG